MKAGAEPGKTDPFQKTGNQLKEKTMKRTIAGVLVGASMVIAGAAMAADGAALYKAKCAMCHGADGAGGPMGQAFKANEFVAANSPEAIIDVILKGRSVADKRYKNIAMGMPPQTASAEEAGALAAYLKSIASK